MEYISDVRIITSKKGFNKLKKFTDKYLKNNNFRYENILNICDIIDENNKERYFGWNNIKWYEGFEGYENVDAIMRGLKYLADNDYSYRYAKIDKNFYHYEEYVYESDKEEEQGLDFLCVNRSFDDEYISQNMAKQNDSDMEI